MPIIVNLDVMLARRNMSLTELSEQVGTAMANPATAVRDSRLARRRRGM